MDFSSLPISNFVLEENLCVDASKSVKEAIEIMATHGVGHILVCTDDVPKGIFTERDFLRNSALSNTDISLIKVERWATKPMRTVRINDTVHNVIEVFGETGIRRLPVVNAANEIIGVCTVQSLLIGLEQLLHRDMRS